MGVALIFLSFERKNVKVKKLGEMLFNTEKSVCMRAFVSVRQERERNKKVEGVEGMSNKIQTDRF